MTTKNIKYIFIKKNKKERERERENAWNYTM